MKREILISAAPQETRAAILEDDAVVEVLVDRPEDRRMVGDIYLGRVEAVLPGIQAAFVDIGTDSDAFLHASDIVDEDGGGNDRPIQNAVRKGEQVLVQVTKEPIGSKGPRSTTEVSLPGRFLVYLPHSDRVGVSRKIDDEDERKRLRALARDVVPDGAGGVIVRTVAEELTRELFEREFEALRATWQTIERSARRAEAPELIHREAGFASGIIRDVFTEQVDALVIDSREIYDEVREYLERIHPDLLDRVHLYDEAEPLFDAHGVEEAIRRAFERRAELPSGGYIVIEPTEALVTVDVNTGRYTGDKNAEETILNTNVAAAREVARQLRLRDIGGIIVIDFIDMEAKEHRQEVRRELGMYLERDRARTRAYDISELGLVEMTRQRVRPSLFQSHTHPCAHCGGTGRVFTPETVARRIQRSVRRAGVEGAERTLTIRTHPEVALHILEEEGHFLRRLERESGLEVDIRDDPLLRQDEFRLLSGPADTDVTSKYVLG